jgi:signal transduction histidine kinase
LSFISDNVSSYYGISKKEFIQKGTFWIDAIHPEDKETVFKITEWMHTHKLPILRKYRIKNYSTGLYIWVHDKSKPKLDDAGNLIEIYGSVKDVTELKNKELELTKINEEMIQIEESERSRISFELHDGLNQTLAVAKMYMSIAQKTGDFSGLSETLELAMLESKNIINNLTPKNLHDLGLLISLQNLFSTIQQTHSLQIDFQYTKYVKTIKFSDFQSFHIYRIIQEALNNTLKHSKSTKFSLTIQVLKKRMISFQMSDDGIGIDFETSEKNNFLLSIRRRVTILKGKINWKSTNGFQISVFIPFSDSSELSKK